MKSYKSLHKKRTGTSFRGYILATYSDLLKSFGDPNSEGDGYKVDVEWVLDTPHGVATIYNYKDGKAYLGERSTPVEYIYEWHVGAKNTESYQWLREKLFERIKASFS